MSQINGYQNANELILILWKACNLTAFIHSITGPVVHPFASRHEGPGILLLGLSGYIGDPNVIDHCGLV
jgi:hypothetical protein